MSGNVTYHHHVEPRVKLYSPREESFLIPLKYIDVSRTTHTNLDVMQEAASMIVGVSMDPEICLILGQVSLVLLSEVRNLQKDICGPGRDWQNGKRHPGQIIYGQNSGGNCEEMLSWRRGRNGQVKNQSSIMLEDYYFIDIEDKEFKETIKNARRNLEHQWLQPCLARHARKASMERSVARLMISSLILRVSRKPVNPKECWYGRISTKLSWGPCCRKGWQFTTNVQFGTQICSHASSHEDSRCKSSSG